MTIKCNKRIGVGSLSLPISIIAIMFSFTYFGEKSVGQVILNSIHIYKMTGITSVILLIISMLIGSKYKQYSGAKLGKNIAIFFILLMFLLTVTNLIRLY